MSYDYFGLKFQKVPVKEKKEKEKLYIKEKEKRENEQGGNGSLPLNQKTLLIITSLINLNNYYK